MFDFSNFPKNNSLYSDENRKALLFLKMKIQMTS